MDGVQNVVQQSYVTEVAATKDHDPEVCLRDQKITAAWIRVAKADHGLADQTGHVHVR
jgi:hypothetical protein